MCSAPPNGCRDTRLCITDQPRPDDCPKVSSWAAEPQVSSSSATMFHSVGCLLKAASKTSLKQLCQFGLFTEDRGYRISHQSINTTARLRMQCIQLQVVNIVRSVCRRGKRHNTVCDIAALNKPVESICIYQDQPNALNQRGVLAHENVDGHNVRLIYQGEHGDDAGNELQFYSSLKASGSKALLLQQQSSPIIP